jgi:hypothetical protein
VAGFALNLKEKFSPDGKRAVEREWIIGNSIIVGLIVIAFLLTIIILALSGHGDLIGRLTLGGGTAGGLAVFINALRAWFGK